MIRRPLSSRKGRGSIADMLDSSTTEYHAAKADLDAAAYRLASAQAKFDACLERMRKEFVPDSKYLREPVVSEQRRR